MQIKPTDLEPGLLRRIEESARASAHILPVPPPPPEGPRITPLRVLGALGMLAALWFLGLMVLGAVVGESGNLSGASWAIFFGSFLGAPALSGYWLRNGWGRPVRRLSAEMRAAVEKREGERYRARVRETPMAVEAVRDVLRVLETRAEADAVYARSVLLLLDLADEGRMPEAQAREILSQLNGLMESNRELTDKLKSVEATLPLDEIDEMNAQREKLTARLASTGDDDVRRATQRSLSMLDTRLQNARELLTLSERIHAQRDAIEQTLASLESSLARMRVAQGVNDGAELERLQATAADLHRQARSVEQAVAEVVRVTGGGG